MKTANKLALLMGAFAASQFIDADRGYMCKTESDRIKSKDSDAEEKIRKAEERRARKALKQGYC